MPDTSSSLLEHLRGHPEPEHWNRFIDLYAPVIQQWAVRNGLQEADTADLIQEVFSILLQKLPEFEYNPALRFRGWIKQVIVNVWRAQLRKRRGVQIPDDYEPAVADPAEAFWEAEFNHCLARRAMQVMRRDFDPSTWQACWAVIIDGRPASEVAVEFGMSVGAVYAARFRVITRLRGELDGMLD